MQYRLSAAAVLAAEHLQDFQAEDAAQVPVHQAAVSHHSANTRLISKEINENGLIQAVDLKSPFLLYFGFMEKKYYTYILLIENNSLYCGYTDDVEKRFKAHLEGKGAKFTRAHKPVKIVYTKEFSTKSEAMKEEYRIKHLSHKEKLELINL